MLSFVICEDEKVLATEYKNEVDKFMMNYDHEYQIKIFSGYSDEFYKYVEKFIELGVSIVGGCCGTTPKYIKKISDNINKLEKINL